LNAALAKAADDLSEACKLSEVQLSVIEQLNADLEGSGRRGEARLFIAINNLIWLMFWLLSL
jgi:hypothetical protein